VHVGTGGGVWGLERGLCQMIGGQPEIVRHLDPVFKTLAPGLGDAPRTPGHEKAGGTAEESDLYCGPSGAGHFVKMVHNGIEYGRMAALKHACAGKRSRGSVVASWLLASFEQSDLSAFSGHVSDSGEGRWTITAAIDESTPAPVLSAALYQRFSARGEEDFADKLLSAMRYQFGGHVER